MLKHVHGIVFQVHSSVTRQVYDSCPTNSLQQRWKHSYLRLWWCNSLALGPCSTV